MCKGTPVLSNGTEAHQHTLKKLKTARACISRILRSRWQLVVGKCFEMLRYAVSEQPTWILGPFSSPSHPLFWPMLRLANHWGWGDNGRRQMFMSRKAGQWRPTTWKAADMSEEQLLLRMPD